MAKYQEKSGAVYEPRKDFIHRDGKPNTFRIPIKSNSEVHLTHAWNDGDNSGGSCRFISNNLTYYFDLVSGIQGFVDDVQSKIDDAVKAHAATLA